MLGVRIAGNLPFASSLCGACAEICPVKIPIPEILIHLRRRAMEGDLIEGPVASPVVAAGAAAAGFAFSQPALYEVGSQALRVVQAPLRRGAWLPSLPPPADRWTMVRPMPAFDASFRQWWRTRTVAGRRQARARRMRIAALLGAAAAVAVLVLSLIHI